MFIVVEGTDGSGKSTLLKKMKSKMNETVFIREPGGCKISEEIRNLVLNNEMSDMTRYFLMLAQRAENQKFIQEKLSENIDIVCDRYELSTHVYQSSMGEDMLTDIENYTKFRKPDIQFILITDYETYIKRKEGNEINDLDPKNEEEFNKVREYYTKASNGLDYVLIDTSNKTQKEVLDEVMNTINTFKIIESCRL